MTDKQIIIDGIDVSGCNRLNTFPMQYGEPHEICLTSLEQWGGQEKYCKDRPNCYYKQLKYLEKAFDYRENTYITNLNNLANEAKFLREKLQAKEQECEELKEHHYELEEKFLELNVKAYSNTLELDQLKQTLTEIKEIAEANKNYIYILPSYSAAGDSLEFSFEFTKNILQKISEVEDD